MLSRFFSRDQKTPKLPELTPQDCRARFEDLLILFQSKRILAFPSVDLLSIAIYDDFDYDRIDYDTLSPSARSTLREVLKDNEATEVRAGHYRWRGVTIRILKSPRSLSSPSLEGLDPRQDVIFLLTPTQLAARILSLETSGEDDIIELAKNLPFNLDKLKSQVQFAQRIHPELGQRLRKELYQCGEFYRLRRQRGILGSFPLSVQRDDDEFAEDLD